MGRIVTVCMLHTVGASLVCMGENNHMYTHTVTVQYLVASTS